MYLLSYMYLFNIPFQDFDQSPVYSSIVNFTFDIHVFVFIYVFVNNCLHSGKLYLPVYFSVQSVTVSVNFLVQKSWFESIFLGVKHWPKS